MNRIRSILYLLLILIMLGSCDYYRINPHRNHISHIPIGQAIESDSFKVCFKEKIFPPFYGRQRATFSEGTKALKQHILDTYEDIGDRSESGYITIRFVVNCEGEAGRFIVHEVGPDYKKKKFNKRIVKQLLGSLQSLKEWKPLQFYDDRYDSYYFLSFKINNGELAEVLP